MFYGHGKNLYFPPVHHLLSKRSRPDDWHAQTLLGWKQQKKYFGDIVCWRHLFMHWVQTNSDAFIMKLAKELYHKLGFSIITIITLELG
jgi:hypothetical protein